MPRRVSTQLIRTPFAQVTRDEDRHAGTECGGIMMKRGGQDPFPAQQTEGWKKWLKFANSSPLLSFALTFHDATFVKQQAVPKFLCSAGSAYACCRTANPRKGRSWKVSYVKPRPSKSRPLFSLDRVHSDARKTIMSPVLNYLNTEEYPTCCASFLFCALCCVFERSRLENEHFTN